MFIEEELKKVDEIRSHYPAAQSTLMGVLHMYLVPMIRNINESIIMARISTRSSKQFAGSWRRLNPRPKSELGLAWKNRMPLFDAKGKTHMNELNIPEEVIERRIFLIRGHKVMMDFQLAELYGVPTKSLNLAVKRNIRRFPEDFMFQCTDEEFDVLKQFLRFQIETSKTEYRGGRRYNPYAFTEQGVAMLSTVLHSERAIQVNIAIMRAFVKLREILGAHKELAFKLEQLETKMEKYDKEIHTIFEAIRRLMAPPEPPAKKRIGFVDEPKAGYKVKRRP